MTHKKKSPAELLIGAHCSAAGGVANALYEGQSIGATTVQLFTANQRTWAAKGLSDEAIARWKEALIETGIRDPMSHDSYLINLGSSKPEMLEKSRTTFRLEVERCLALDIRYLNFHPGAALDAPVEACLDLIVESLLELEEALQVGSLTLLLETTAGQGSVVGARFEELAYILERVKGRIPVGVCIDTCHIFAAGYDIRTPEGWKSTLQHFDETIGLSYLKAFHCNDSMKPLGSRRDRHACLGDGEIGLDSFKFLMTNPLTRSIPKYLETPEGDARWKEEIALLREFAA